MSEKRTLRSKFMALFGSFQALLVLITIGAYFLSKRDFSGQPPDPLFVQLSFVIIGIPILTASFVVLRWIRPNAKLPSEMGGGRLLAASATTMALTEFPSFLALAGVGMGFYRFFEFVLIPFCGLIINFLVLLPAVLGRAEIVSNGRAVE